MFLVDLRSKKITGKEAEVALGRARTPSIRMPHDPEQPTVTFGVEGWSGGYDNARFWRTEASLIRWWRASWLHPGTWPRLGFSPPGL
jgi:glycine hydroxymethyltransferase